MTLCGFVTFYYLSLRPAHDDYVEPCGSATDCFYSGLGKSGDLGVAGAHFYKLCRLSFLN